ncbi:MAG: hypothetical protein JW818_07275 [Pirellulales bacterium]|nr:hypothetical protein [Pirellulales bacterium]
MHATTTLMALLLGQNILEDASRRVRQGPPTLKTEQWVLFGVIFGAVLGIMVLWSWYLNRRGRRRRFHSPARLFWGLCRLHRLGWPDRWILWSIARHQKLDDPARVFLEPVWLGPNRLAPSLRTQAARLGRLRQTLFGDLGPPEPLPPEAAVSETPETTVPPTPAVPPVSVIAPVPTTPTLDAPPWPFLLKEQPRDAEDHDSKT